MKKVINNNKKIITCGAKSSNVKVRIIGPKENSRSVECTNSINLSFPSCATLHISSSESEIQYIIDPKIAG